MPRHHPDAPLPMLQVLLCGGLVVTLSMGVRHGFGLWLQPVTQEMGWTRESFSLALAVQNIAWGVFGIFGGMVADRFGAFRVLIGVVQSVMSTLWGEGARLMIYVAMAAVLLLRPHGLLGRAA